MYRSLLAVVVATAWAAPQTADNSDITYVKIQPIASEEAQPRATALRESRIENLPLTIRGYDTSKEISRHTRSEEDDHTTVSPYDEATKTAEPATETTEHEIAPETTEVPSRRPSTKRPSPRFFSKLSYFEKNNNFDNPISKNLANLLDSRTYKRKFISKCRCEKIWNCPKLQITVPRCPNEYFLCCF